MDIGTINRQLPEIFELRIDKDKLELYTVMNSDVVTMRGKSTRQMKRFKTIGDKKDIDSIFKGMQTILDMFYILSKVDKGDEDEKNNSE